MALLCHKEISLNLIKDHYKKNHPNFKIFNEQEVFAQKMYNTYEYEPKEGTNSSGRIKRERPVGSINILPSIKKQKINNKVDNPSERAAKGLATFTINEQYATDTV